jgi:hypothetical protein
VVISGREFSLGPEPQVSERSDLAGLQTLADADDQHAAEQLAGRLAERRDLEQLRARARADAGDQYATELLAGWLANRGDLNGAEQLLRACAEPSRENAQLLATVPTRQDRREEAERLRRFGLNPDGSTASG